jgi:hypothetical protein
MAFNDIIYLVDIEPRIDTETGKNKLQIVKETMVYADQQEVGLNEYYSAVGAKIILSATFEIPIEYYSGEKYIITGDRKKQYEISRVAKGRTPAYVKLPVVGVQKKNLLEGLTSG